MQGVDVPDFDTLTATNAQAKGVDARRNLTTVPFETAVRLQELIVKASESEETTPSALAQLARAWSELEDRKRIIKMKPAPKPVDVQALHAARSKRNKPSQPFDYGQVVAQDTTSPSVLNDKPSPEGHKSAE